MAGDELFDELPEQAKPQTGAGLGAPRLREPARDQIELRSVDIDSLIGEDHAARLIWAYVEDLDLRELEDAGSKRGRHTRASRDHAALLAGAVALRDQRRGRQRAGSGAAVREPRCLSLAVRRGIGELSHVEPTSASAWRASRSAVDGERGGVGACGLVDLDQLTQDGVRIRASAGATSFRRRATLEHHLAWRGGGGASQARGR